MKVRNKVQKQIYGVRVLNNLLPRNLCRNIIQTHVISHLTYAMPVWAGNLSVRHMNKLSACLFKVLRLHCHDFQRRYNNSQLCELSGLRSFNSLRIINDAILVHKLYSDPTNSHLTNRMTEQCIFSYRYLDRLQFLDLSSKKHGRMSIVNRAKRIVELIPFSWTSMPHHLFKFKMKQNIPKMIA